MKQHILVQILLVSLLSSCFNSGQSHVSDEASVRMESISDLDTSHTLETWNKEDWFNVGYMQLCDEENGDFVSHYTVTKKGVLNPYDTLQVNFMDSVIVSFEFIADCCLEFSGEVMNRNDTLFLGYGHATESGAACDCYCDYKMIYRMKRSGKHWNTIIIKNDRLK